MAGRADVFGIVSEENAFLYFETWFDAWGGHIDMTMVFLSTAHMEYTLLTFRRM